MDTKIVKARYEFTEEEINAMGRTVAELEMDLKAVEDEKDASNKRYKERIDALYAKIQLLSRKVTDQYEFREFKCRVEPNYSDGMIHYRSVDTEKVILSEPMTPEERQQNFGFKN